MSRRTLRFWVRLSNVTLLVFFLAPHTIFLARALHTSHSDSLLAMDPKEDDFASPVIVAPDDNSSPAATDTTTRVIVLPLYLHSNLQ
jgi:hypothetical protein